MSDETTDRHDLTSTLPWVAEGTQRLLEVVAGCTDGELRAPSLLPGWSRAHVVGHVARNAEALGRLLHWAATGEETPMYADGQQRAREIETSAALPADTLRADCADTAARLGQAMSTMEPEAWRATVRSAQGRTIPAAEVPWMRDREVWLHAVDLDSGLSFADIPGELLDVLIDDVATKLSAGDGCPALLITLTGPGERTVRLGPPEATAGQQHGSRAQIAGWLTGRHPADRPALPRWL